MLPDGGREQPAELQAFGGRLLGKHQGPGDGAAELRQI